MSSSGLTRMTKRILTRLESVEMREKVQEYQGQIFIWNKAAFEAAMRAQTSEENVKQLVEIWETNLASQDKRQMSIRAFKRRFLDAKEYVKQNKIEGYSPSTHKIYAVFNYYTVQRIKSQVGKTFSELTGKDSKIVTGRLDKGDIAAEAQGTQIGHGEFGHAVSTTKVLSAEAVTKTKTSVAKYSSSQAYKNITKSIREYKQKVNVSLSTEHYQELTATGRFTKKYTPILSDQDTAGNLKEALDEKAALDALIKSIEKEYKDLVNQEGSDTLKEAIEAVTLYNLTTSKKIKYKGTAKPRKKVKSNTKSSPVKGKVTTKRSVNISAGVGAVKAGKSSAGSSRTRRSAAPRAGFSQTKLYALLNTKINATVAKNMEDPALNYQSGVFAGSVKITDVNTTQKGLPSVGYTYQLYPYQTFEPGYAQGDIDRDPRKLIDKSIREIAAQMVTGRLYTRRQ